MSNTVTGSITSAVSLTTKYATGTAGYATDVDNFGGVPIVIGAAQSAGQVFTTTWSNTYTSLTGTTTLDLTALTGVNGGTVNFTTSGVRYIWAVNSDTTAGHDVQIGPGASNGLITPWGNTAGYTTAYGGCPSAGVSVTQYGNTPNGDFITLTNLTSAGWTIDSTHKTVQLVVPSGTVSSFTILIAG